MAETKLPRLLAAAKEFNVGQDTLMDFLIGKGFPKDDLKPTSKLSEDMYRALQQEFQQDKAAKLKSDQVDLPKGALAEAKKKKEEEEILFRKEDKKTVKKEEPVAAPPVVEEKPKKEEPKKEEEVVVKLEAPEIEKPKVLDKIDLSTIDSSTRPKKTARKKEETVAAAEVKPAETKKKKTKKEEQEEEAVIAAKTVVPEVETTPVTEEDDLPPVIENIEVEKLTGPKILGKIDLPLDSDTRPKKDEKRKRKRIPIEKKDNKQTAVPDKEKRQGGGGFSRTDNRGRGGP
ncbi:MAG TPA: translation initiation factor IF-2, partial [Chitinophagaceae bacterium]|nr:translation initiation factor IF-2 [Chitinophagaceae bacterium]